MLIILEANHVQGLEDLLQRALLNHIKTRILGDYENHIGGKLAFQHITLSFQSEFIQWLQDKKYTDNYIGTQIKNIKTVMLMLLKEGFTRVWIIKNQLSPNPKRM